MRFFVTEQTGITFRSNSPTSFDDPPAEEQLKAVKDNARAVLVRMNSCIQPDAAHLARTAQMLLDFDADE